MQGNINTLTSEGESDSDDSVTNDHDNTVVNDDTENDDDFDGSSSQPFYEPKTTSHNFNQTPVDTPLITTSYHQNHHREKNEVLQNSNGANPANPVDSTSSIEMNPNIIHNSDNVIGNNIKSQSPATDKSNPIRTEHSPLSHQYDILNKHTPHTKGRNLNSHHHYLGNSSPFVNNIGSDMCDSSNSDRSMRRSSIVVKDDFIVRKSSDNISNTSSGGMGNFRRNIHHIRKPQSDIYNNDREDDDDLTGTGPHSHRSSFLVKNSTSPQKQQKQKQKPQKNDRLPYRKMTRDEYNLVKYAMNNNEDKLYGDTHAKYYSGKNRVYLNGRFVLGPDIVHFIGSIIGLLIPVATVTATMASSENSLPLSMLLVLWLLWALSLGFLLLTGTSDPGIVKRRVDDVDVPDTVTVSVELPDVKGRAAAFATREALKNIHNISREVDGGGRGGAVGQTDIYHDSEDEYNSKWNDVRDPISDGSRDAGCVINDRCSKLFSNKCFGDKMDRKYRSRSVNKYVVFRGGCLSIGGDDCNVQPLIKGASALSNTSVLLDCDASKDLHDLSPDNITKKRKREIILLASNKARIHPITLLQPFRCCFRRQLALTSMEKAILERQEEISRLFNMIIEKEEENVRRRSLLHLSNKQMNFLPHQSYTESLVSLSEGKSEPPEPEWIPMDAGGGSSDWKLSTSEVRADIIRALQESAVWQHSALSAVMWSKTLLSVTEVAMMANSVTNSESNGRNLGIGALLPDKYEHDEAEDEGEYENGYEQRGIRDGCNRNINREDRCYDVSGHAYRKVSADYRMKNRSSKVAVRAIKCCPCGALLASGEALNHILGQYPKHLLGRRLRGKVDGNHLPEYTNNISNVNTIEQPCDDACQDINSSNFNALCKVLDMQSSPAFISNVESDYKYDVNTIREVSQSSVVGEGMQDGNCSVLPPQSALSGQQGAMVSSISGAETGTGVGPHLKSNHRESTFKHPHRPIICHNNTSSCSSSSQMNGKSNLNSEGASDCSQANRVISTYSQQSNKSPHQLSFGTLGDSHKDSVGFLNVSNTQGRPVSSLMSPLGTPRLHIIASPLSTLSENRTDAVDMGLIHTMNQYKGHHPRCLAYHGIMLKNDDELSAIISECGGGKCDSSSEMGKMGNVRRNTSSYDIDKLLERLRNMVGGMMRSVYSPIGIVPLVKKEVTIRYCFICCVYRGPRTHHCRSCDNCVDLFDHHCPWTGTCIGIGNYQYFLLFLLFLNSYFVFTMVCCIVAPVRYSILGDVAIEDALLAQFWFPVILFVVLAVPSNTILALFFYHCYLLSIGVTTLEHLRQSWVLSPQSPNSSLPFSSDEDEEETGAGNEKRGQLTAAEEALYATDDEAILKSEEFHSCTDPMMSDYEKIRELERIKERRRFARANSIYGINKNGKKKKKKKNIWSRGGCVSNCLSRWTNQIDGAVYSERYRCIMKQQLMILDDPGVQYSSDEREEETINVTSPTEVRVPCLDDDDATTTRDKVSPTKILLSPNLTSTEEQKIVTRIERNFESNDISLLRRKLETARRVRQIQGDLIQVASTPSHTVRHGDSRDLHQAIAGGETIAHGDRDGHHPGIEMKERDAAQQYGFQPSSLTVYSPAVSPKNEVNVHNVHQREMGSPDGCDLNTQTCNIETGQDSLQHNHMKKKRRPQRHRADRGSKHRHYYRTTGDVYDSDISDDINQGLHTRGDGSNYYPPPESDEGSINSSVFSSRSVNGGYDSNMGNNNNTLCNSIYSPINNLSFRGGVRLRNNGPLADGDEE